MRRPWVPLLILLSTCAVAKTPARAPATSASGATILTTQDGQRWQNYGGAWQRESELPIESREDADTRTGTTHGSCALAGMVEVTRNGKHAFCMDRYEYPNYKGANPYVMVSWDRSKQLCEKEGKRLCTEVEWDYACEGDEKRTYSYSSTYTPDTCNNMHPNHPVNFKALYVKDQQTVAEELEKLWQGQPIGASEGCVSQHGVYDLIGNVDEWVVSSLPKCPPGKYGGCHFYQSLLKGGYWGEVKSYCRRYTDVHGPGFTFYQIGFRCCSDK